MSRKRTPAAYRRAQLVERDGPHCHWCGVLTVEGIDPHTDARTEDHVVPRSKGGVNDLSNLVLACSACNHARNDDELRPVAEGPTRLEQVAVWRQRVGASVAVAGPEPESALAVALRAALGRDE